MQVSAGELHFCVVTDTGGLECTGSNESGQLGNGTTSSSGTPVGVVGLASGVASVSAGAAHTCAVTSAGGAKCWGWNLDGQIGDGTTSQTRTTPTDVVGLTSGVSDIAAGSCDECITPFGNRTDRGSSTCALTTAGGVKCWGSNGYGQLGDGTTADSSVPVDVVGLSSGVADIDVQQGRACAVLTSGAVKCWGYNATGALGDGTTTDSSVPVDVVGLSSGITAVATGEWHTCALTSGGGVKCWGANFLGQLGDGTSTERLTPVDVAGLSGVVAISADDTSTALTASGGLQSWGGTAADVPYLASGVVAFSHGGSLLAISATGQIRNGFPGQFASWPAGCLRGYGDSDGDAICDVDDPCAGGSNFVQLWKRPPHPRLVLTRINTETTPGNDQLKLTGTWIPLPVGATFDDLDPIGEGIRLVLQSPDAIAAEFVAPPGAYGGKGTAGWVASGGASPRWKFTDATGPGGRVVTRLTIKRIGSPLGGAAVDFTVQAKAGDFPIDPSDFPIVAQVILGGASAGTAGLCGHGFFGTCPFNASGNTATCKM